MTRLLLALALLIGCAVPAAAQPRGPFRGDGVEVFAGLLHYHGLTPVKLDQFGQTLPAGRVMVFIGRDAPVNPVLIELARETLAGGGSVLWAIDRGLDLGTVLGPRTRLAISDRGVMVPDGSPCLNDDAAYPLLVPRPPDGLERVLLGANLKVPDPAALLMAGLTRVAANDPGLVTDGPGGTDYVWTELADLPAGSRAVGEPTRRRRPPLVVAASSGSGAKTHRALVVANSRVFTNRLLAAEGADNLAFADNAVAWLSAGGSRKACVLVSDGRVVPLFDAVSFRETPPIPPIPIPDFLDPVVQKKLTDLANETLGKLEANNAFNRLITKDLDQPGRLRYVLETVAIIVGAVALALVLRRLLGAKHAPDHTPVPRDPARPGGADGAAKQREELLQRGEYLGLVAEYLRGWFEECGAAAGADLPEIRVRAGVPDKPLRDWLRILWGVAYDPPAGRGGRAARRAVPYSRWKQLEPTIHAAQAAHRAGDWRFAEPKEPA